ncbi:MAG: heavy metal translocating P-type ATPase [Rhodospirillales bacterium]|nr:heavy metal translocating P-type ATPase [Rhodospirillales bacterium]
MDDEARASDQEFHAPAWRAWVAPRRALAGLAALGLALGGAAAALGQPGLERIAFQAPAALVALVLAADLIVALRRGVFGVDAIALLALLAALALGQALAGAIVALMATGGAALEEFALGRARADLAALLARAPRIAHRLDGETVLDLPAERIAPGDRLLVRAGEIVPVDGIAEAAALLDTSALTGEPEPRAIGAGEALASGTVNAGAPFAMAARATAASSTYAGIVRLVRAAERERPPMVRLADRFALGFLGATLALAGAAWALGGPMGGPIRAFAVLVVATPCPLILAAPVALMAGISRAARRGIVVKGGGALERLARARVGLFDKTGTLTAGTPRLLGVEVLAGFDPDRVLALAGALEQASGHAVAGAILAAARALETALPAPEAVTEIPGGGLSGIVAGTRVAVGSAAMLTEAGLIGPDGDAGAFAELTEGPAARLAAAATAVAWVVLDGRLAGALLLADPVRPETPRALAALRARGVGRLVMLSGDRPEAAARIGTALGLDAAFGGLTPEGKIAAARAERARGPTLMVGDGINDAPALAAADIGIAMGARGAAAAAEAADAVITIDRLDRVPEAIGIARRARAIALQSVLAGMALSAIAMGFAAAGALAPVAGALLQEAIDVAVILNALRVLGGATGRALPDRGAVATLDREHPALRALLERMRLAAAALDRAGPGADGAALRRIAEDFAAIVLPHQQAEEARLYPVLARALGGRDPVGTLALMHDGIARDAALFRALVGGMAPAGPSAAEAREAVRLLHALEAMLAMHLDAEEALVAAAEEPARTG